MNIGDLCVLATAAASETQPRPLPDVHIRCCQSNLRRPLGPPAEKLATSKRYSCCDLDLTYSIPTPCPAKQALPGPPPYLQPLPNCRLLISAESL
jgi:hypothetical protein